MSNINHKGATTMSNQSINKGGSMNPFNPVANPLVLMSEFGLVLYQQGQEFVLVSVEGEAFFSTVEEAFNHYCRLSSDSQLVFDDFDAAVEDEEVQSYVEAFDTSGECLDWDLKCYDYFGNEVEIGTGNSNQNLFN